MVTAEGLTLRSPRGQHRPQGALQCRPRAHCNHCWGYTGPATQARCHPCSGSFLLFFKRHHLPWSMTQRARLLLGSLGDFRGTILMRRVRALSRPWPETPTSVSSSKRLLMRTFSSRAGSIQYVYFLLSALEKPCCVHKQAGYVYFGFVCSNKVKTCLNDQQ